MISIEEIFNLFIFRCNDNTGYAMRYVMQRIHTDVIYSAVIF